MSFRILRNFFLLSLLLRTLTPIQPALASRTEPDLSKKVADESHRLHHELRKGNQPDLRAILERLKKEFSPELFQQILEPISKMAFRISVLI
jgi:hypothetical protein